MVILKSQIERLGYNLVVLLNIILSITNWVLSVSYFLILKIFRISWQNITILGKTIVN